MITAVFADQDCPRFLPSPKPQIMLQDKPCFTLKMPEYVNLLFLPCGRVVYGVGTGTLMYYRVLCPYAYAVRTRPRCVCLERLMRLRNWASMVYPDGPGTLTALE